MRATLAHGLEASARVWERLFGPDAPPITNDSAELDRRRVYAQVLADELRDRPDLLGGRAEEADRFAFASVFCRVLREQQAGRTGADEGSDE